MAKWYEEAIFYHIYPLGLLGAPKTHTEEGVTHRLRELDEWVPHMKELGVTATYIGPLFESTTHGYDTKDYRQVDSRLGDNEDFRRFVKLCHEHPSVLVYLLLLGGNNHMNVPQHVAIILDGNGRWAKAKGMPRNYGHAQGSKNVERICEEAWRMGIKYLTVYAFSTENWNRPDDEVNALMKLLRNYMKTCLKTAAKNDMKVRVIGDITRLDEDIQKRILELEEATKNNGGLNFQIAINYGSRDEMIRAIRKIAKDCVDGKVDPAEIKEETFEQYLDTKGIPDPDLMIRTSGELRLSNYLLWQLAYTEFYFTDVPWPDFSKEELEKAIETYNHRDRRYGGVKEEEEQNV